MDTIKKKMLAMKNEKDAAMDRAEQLEQNLKDTETAKSEVSVQPLSGQWSRSVYNH